MGSERPSVAVVGLGSVGAMTARRGARVTGYEQYSPGHDRGAHGGETRIFRTAYLESPDYVPLLRRAQELWRDLEKESGASLLHLNGRADDRLGGDRGDYERPRVRRHVRARPRGDPGRRGAAAVPAVPRRPRRERAARP